MRILICEEDGDYVGELVKLIKMNTDCEDVWIETYDSQEKAIKQSFEKIDLAIIGTLMDKKDSFELGKMIQELSNALVIYVSNDEKTMCKAFEQSAFQFIPKTINEYVEKEIQRAFDELLIRDYEMIFHLDNGEDMTIHPIYFEYIEFCKNKMILVKERQRLMGFCDDCEQVKSKLKELSYFQMSQKYFVNVKYIGAMEKGKVYMRNGDCLKTSLRNLDVSLKVVRKSIT